MPLKRLYEVRFIAAIAISNQFPPLLSPFPSFIVFGTAVYISSTKHKIKLEGRRGTGERDRKI